MKMMRPRNPTMPTRPSMEPSSWAVRASGPRCLAETQRRAYQRWI